MSELIALAVDCVHCRQRVRLFVSEGSEDTEHPVVWTCPHCYESNRGQLLGQLEFIDVVERDD
jgi:hypothetical protein